MSNEPLQVRKQVSFAFFLGWACCPKAQILALRGMVSIMTMIANKQGNADTSAETKTRAEITMLISCWVRSALFQAVSFCCIGISHYGDFFQQSDTFERRKIGWATVARNCCRRRCLFLSVAALGQWGRTRRKWDKLEQLLKNSFVVHALTEW